MDKNTQINEMDITDEFALVPSEESGAVVAKKLRELGEHGIILVTESGEVVGFVSQKEILDLVAKGDNPAKYKAGEIMNNDFVEVLEDETLGNILPVVATSYPNAIVVIADDRSCVGFFSKNDYKEALATMGIYDQSREPQTADEWRTKGIAMSSQGKTDEALICYKKAVETSPNQERAWSKLAKSLEGLNRVKDAIMCYDKVSTINKNNDGALLSRGRLYSKQKTQNLAIQCYSLALQVNPNNVEALMNIGLEYTNAGNIGEALKHFDKAQEITGETPEIWYRKGNAYDHVKQHDEAVKCYDRALILDEKFEDALFDKGVALSKLGKNDDALKCMEQILEINPENESAHDALETYKESGAFGFA